MPSVQPRFPTHDTEDRESRETGRALGAPEPLGLNPYGNAAQVEVLRQSQSQERQIPASWVTPHAFGNLYVAELVKPVQGKGKNGEPLNVPGLSKDCSAGEKACDVPGGIKEKEIEGVPFVQGHGDKGPISANDVKQGKVGSCYLLAALIGIANQDPAKIDNMISYDKEKGTYKVTLYLRDKSGQLKPKVIDVDAGFYVDSKGKPLYAGIGDKGKHGPELWVMLIEKAYAQHKGSYEGIDYGSGGRNMEVLEMLTGNKAKSISLKGAKPEAIVTTLQECLAKGDVMTTVTHSVKSDPELEKLGLVGNHRYAVTAINGDTVTLQNPYGGENATVKISVADFKKHFVDIKYAATKPPNAKGG